MNVLILGSSGLLGKAIFNRIIKNKNLDVFHNGLKKRIKNIDSLQNLEVLILKSSPSLIINCCGLTNLLKCEINKKKSNLINYKIVENIFKIKKKRKLSFKLIHFSTDQLYDGKKNLFSSEKKKVVLNNQYSKDKYKADKLVLKNKSLVLRVNFFGIFKNNSGFLNWVYKMFKSQNRFYLYEDVIFNPLSITTLSNIINKIIINIYKKNIYGLYNLGSRDGMSKNEFAIYFAKKNKIYNKNYMNIKVNETNKVLTKSKNMLMNIKKFEKKFNITLPKIKYEIGIESKKIYKNDY